MTRIFEPIFPPHVTPEETEAQFPDSETERLAAEVFARLSQINDDDGVQDPQGRLFRLAMDVCDETPALAGKQMSDADRQATEGALRAATQRLPPEQREVLMLHVSDGLTYRQIAARLQLSDPVVLRRLRVAYCTLRMST
jgi:RNA polymerase sigma factor (sigma-70 family)